MLNVKCSYTTTLHDTGGDIEEVAAGHPLTNELNDLIIWVYYIAGPSMLHREALVSTR